jgi:hypothetical protein
MKDYTNISSMDELIEHEYGSKGSDSRIEFEKQSKIFIEKVLFEEAVLDANLENDQNANRSLESSGISPSV